MKIISIVLKQMFWIGLGLSLTLGVLPIRSGQAQGTARHILVPIGGGYSDIYAGFSQLAVANRRGEVVRILVLPLPYASNPFSITEAERQDNLEAAEARRFQIEEACKRAAPELSCVAVLAPVFTRPEAQDPGVSAFFPADLAAVFILGGDQTIAMQVVADTPLEQELQAAYERGVVIAGTSAGGGMLSRNMLAGYAPNAAAGSSLNFGSVELWNSPERRGLVFGLPQAVLDQHFFQRGRLGRLLSAIVQPGAPDVGIGVDAYTGVQVTEATRVENVFGLYVVAILDAQTYHAAEGVRYVGPQNTLSLRNVLVHLLAPGEFNYDLQQRRHSLAAPPERLERDFSTLTLPEGAGPLILAGDLSRSLNGNPILQRFLELCGGEARRAIVIAAGYPSRSSAQRMAEKYAAALGEGAVTLVIEDGGESLALPEQAACALLVGRDQARLPVSQLEPIRPAWLAGMPLLLDNATAAAAGSFYSAHPPTPAEGEELELAVQKSFLTGRTELRAGLKLLDLTVEPQLLDDNRWGRWFSLAYHHPDLLTLGLNQDSAVEISAEGVRVLGDKPALLLDLSAASLALGGNGGYVIANGLLDVFAPGENVAAEPADQAARYTRQPTPVVMTGPSATPTLEPTQKPPATVAATPTSSPIPTRQLPSPTFNVPPITSPTLPVERVSSAPVWLALGGLLLLLAFFLGRLRRNWRR